MQFAIHRLATTLCAFLTVMSISFRLSEHARAISSQTSSSNVVVYQLNGDIYSCELPDGVTRRLTRDGGNGKPAWSPSGNWIAYFHDGPNNSGLHLMNRNGGANHTVPCRAGWQATYSFSPSTEEIAVVTDGGSLAITPLTGGKSRHIVDSIEGDATSVIGVTWSPDGLTLAYVTEHYDTRIGDGTHDKNTPYVVKLWQTDISGHRRPHVLYVSKEHEHVPLICRWSSDSRYLLFWTLHCYPGGSINLDGMPLFLCRVGNRPGRSRYLFGRDYKTEVLSIPAFVQCSRDSSFAAISVGASRFWVETKRIALVDLKIPYRPRFVTPSRLAATCPTWSQDGSRIAYLAAPTAIAEGDAVANSLSQMRLWVMNADGTGQHRLASGQVADSAGPRWLADGHHLVFERTLPGRDRYVNNVNSLWMISTDGRELRCIARHVGGEVQDWSASGNFDVWSPTTEGRKVQLR